MSAPALNSSRGDVSLRSILVGAIFVLAGILLGVGSYTFYYAKGASYLSDDPQACVNCHIMRDQYDSWSHSSHKAVATCNSCHTPHDVVGKYLTKAENGFRHSSAFTLMNFEEPIRMRPESRSVVEANCLDCHRALVSTITSSHAESKDAVDCIACHRSVGHAGK